MSLVPADDPSPADWFVEAEGPWYVKASYGPPGLQAYARVSLEREDEGFDFPAFYQADNDKILTSVLATLREHTSTPDVIHVGVWEGWGHSEPRGARFSITSRRYALLTGPIADVLDPVALGVAPGETDTPHLVWPDDHAWFVCWDPDEKWNFSVGGSGSAIAELVGGGQVIAEIVPYGTPEDDWSW